MKHYVLLGSAVGLLCLGLLAGLGRGEDQPKREKGPPQGYPDLVGALKKVPGVLGVQATQMPDGKQVIFAWFKDKRALLKWYYGDTHRMVMSNFFPEYEARGKVLKGYADDFGPIMAIASITPAKKQTFKESVLPISQIAIELYQPVNGGVYLGGRFAPDSVQVKDMIDGTKK